MTTRPSATTETATGAAIGAGVGASLWGLSWPTVSLLGFGAKGIAAGSTAASMMSSAAIANGGGVAAGSTVATLQSLGALGLGTTVGLGLVATGVVVGGVTTVGVRSLYSQLPHATGSPDVPDAAADEGQSATTSSRFPTPKDMWTTTKATASWIQSTGIRATATCHNAIHQRLYPSVTVDAPAPHSRL